MSDFSYTAKCPGCGQRFAPDDGLCCVRCMECGAFGQWHYCAVCDDYLCPDCHDCHRLDDEDDEEENQR